MTRPRTDSILDRAAALVEESAERALDQYSRFIGRSVADVPTPALLLDLPTCVENIERMATAISRLQAGLRPHIKVHKSPRIAQMQTDNGASGLSMATVWELAVMAASGFDDLFLVNTVAGASKLDALAEVARTHRVLVAVESIDGARMLDRAAARAGSHINVVLEVDTGMDRAGVDTIDQAVAVGRGLSDFPNLTFVGITGYEGHCSLTPELSERRKLHRQAMEMFLAVANGMEALGIGVPIRSAGGTATWEWTASQDGITEIQAGSYVTMDNFHCEMAPQFEVSLTVLATVISRPAGRLIVDAGNKSVGAAPLASIMGATYENLRFDEEHGIFVDADQGRFELGDVIRIIPGYAPATVNLYDVFHVVRDDVVVDIWPVVPRGPGAHGLAVIGGPPG